MHIDPQSLVPKLPKPQELQPFPTTLAIRYSGHRGKVRALLGFRDQMLSYYFSFGCYLFFQTRVLGADNANGESSEVEWVLLYSVNSCWEC